MEKIYFRWKAPMYLWLFLTVCIPFTNQAQSVKRQCISNYGSIVASDNVTFNQTIGQPYGTSALYNDGTSVLQGFQQPVVFTLVVVESSLSKNISLSVFPNPATYTIAIKSSKVIEQSLIKAVDVNGNQVFSEAVPDLHLHHINCGSWSNGIYLLTIYDSMQHSQTLKLIISK
jgi:hypothetical protein